MRALWIACCAAAAAACASTEGKLRDLAWGPAVEADYASLVQRAREQTLKQYPKGFDPDRTDEERGDFWTVWHYSPSMWYRETTRKRAHVKVEDLGGGKARVGVAVVKQRNANIDNPHDVDEARWVETSVDEQSTRLLAQGITLRMLDAEPSEYWKEKRRTGRRETPREDLIDRSKDVDLSSPSDPRDVRHLDPITGDGDGD